MVNIYGAPNCILVSNNTLPYPHCCPQPVCSDFSNDLDPAYETGDDSGDVIIESYDVTMGEDYDYYSQDSTSSTKNAPKESEELVLVCLQHCLFVSLIYKFVSLQHNESSEEEIKPSDAMIEAFPSWFYGDAEFLPKKK